MRIGTRKDSPQPNSQKQDEALKSKPGLGKTGIKSRNQFQGPLPGNQPYLDSYNQLSTDHTHQTQEMEDFGTESWQQNPLSCILQFQNVCCELVWVTHVKCCQTVVYMKKKCTCASVFLPPTEHCRCCGVTLPQRAVYADRFHLVWVSIHSLVTSLGFMVFVSQGGLNVFRGLFHPDENTICGENS